ncbi:hypothetical protein ACWGJ2_34625 [Streptomyces sp. NPDC054796]
MSRLPRRGAAGALDAPGCLDAPDGLDAPGAMDAPDGLDASRASATPRVPDTPCALAPAEARAPLGTPSPARLAGPVSDGLVGDGPVSEGRPLYRSGPTIAGPADVQWANGSGTRSRPAPVFFPALAIAVAIAVGIAIGIGIAAMIGVVSISTSGAQAPVQKLGTPDTGLFTVVPGHTVGGVRAPVPNETVTTVGTALGVADSVTTAGGTDHRVTP